MRIVVSGTHASGKSTLISDFVAAHPQFEVLGDPFELIDEVGQADASSFFAQLRVSAARLVHLKAGDSVIAERGPLDFVAYLRALETLRRPGRSSAALERGEELTRLAMAHVDLLVVLPLSARDRIDVPMDEDPELREVMDDALLDLSDDPDLVGAADVVELTGDPATRLQRLEAAAGLTPSSGTPTDRAPSADAHM